MFGRWKLRFGSYRWGGSLLVGWLLLSGLSAAAQPAPAASRPNGGWGATWSPRGDRLAFLSSNDGMPAEAWVGDPQGGSLRRLTHGGADELAWSPHGATLTYTTRRRGRAERWEVDLASGKERPQTARLTVPERPGATPSPDGRLLAYTRAEQGYEDLYLSAAGQETRLTTGFTVGQVAWSPKGTQLAFDGRNALSKGLPQVWLYDLPTQKLAHIGSTGSFAPVWSADGELLAYTMLYSSKGNRLALARLHEAAGRRPPSKHAPPPAAKGVPLDSRKGRLVEDLLYQGDGLAWSPTTSQLAVVVRGERGRELRLLRPEGTVAASFTKPGLEFRFPVWSPDGKRLAFEAIQPGRSAFSEVWVTDAAGKEWCNLTPSRPAYWGLSPGGDRLFLLGNQDGVVRAFSAEAAGLRALPHTEGAVAVATDPAGTRVLVLRPQEVALLTAEGAVLSTLARAGASDARWSPRGDRVAVGGGETVTLLSVSTEGKLAESASLPGADPAWRADGTGLAFVRDNALWRADAAGQGAAVLATVPRAAGEEVILFRPAWEEKGERFAVAAARARAGAWRQELWVGSPSAAPARIYTEDVATEYALSPVRWESLPVWSEGRVLFSSDRGGSPQVWSVRPEGSDLRALTPRETVWAALGSRGLVFVRLDSDLPLWKATADGANLASLVQ